MNEDSHDEREKRIEAELLAEAFFQLLATRYGLKPEDIPEHLEDLRWVRKHRTGIDRIGWSVALGVLAIAVSGIASMLWQGFKESIGRP
jgi:hypothetical protein